MTPRPGPPRHPPALSAGAIVAAAVGIARREGIAAVSMRRLADEFAVSAMALYRHVEDREHLLLRMLDGVAVGVAAPPDGGRPRERLTAIVRSLHAALRQDPWVVQVLAADGLASPAILPTVEGIFAALAEAGLGPDDARGAYLLLIQYVYGEVLVHHHDRADSYARRMVGAADPRRFPYLAAIVADGDQARLDHAHDNLVRILDGILGSA